jgi:outer membrane receptor protein involved in Fe transport
MVQEALRDTPGLQAEFASHDPRFDDARIRGFDARPSQCPQQPSLAAPVRAAFHRATRAGADRGGLINLVSHRPTLTASGRLPAITLLDASISDAWYRYKLSVNASNLFNKNYVASCTGANDCYYRAHRDRQPGLSLAGARALSRKCLPRTRRRSGG